MAFDWLTISFDLHDNKITKKPPGGGREAKNQPPFWTGGLGRFRKFGGCRCMGGYGRLRGQWVKVIFILQNMFCRRELKPAEDITPEERDARTAFCMQLARNIRPRDLEEFFSKVGQVSHKS